MALRLIGKSVGWIGLVAALLPTVAFGAEPAAQPTAPAVATNEAAAKQKIMESEQWRQMKTAFDQWLSVQKIYDADQAAQLPNRFRQKIAGMSAAELQAFLEKMETKMAVLLGSEAAQARDWLGHFVSARAVFSDAELQQFDIFNMTTAQLDAALRKAETRRLSRQRSAQANSRSRQSQIQNQREQQRQQEQQRSQARAAARAASHNTRLYQSQFAPREPDRTPPPRPTFFVDPLGGVIRALP